MIRAEKTLAAIDAALAGDGGEGFRAELRDVLPDIEDIYSGGAGRRNGMGISGLGHDCARRIWYSFRWATKRDLEPRIIRLFNRGHMEEARFIALLRVAGVRVSDEQMPVVDGHLASFIDGVAQDVPDCPDQRLLLEFKTSGDSGFKKLVSGGVRVANETHYVQMQVYMKLTGLDAALYLVVNKNTDELHGEIVQADGQCADRYIQHGQNIIARSSPPPRINDSPAWWQCKNCDHYQTCHGDQPVRKSCRTCRYSRTERDGGWRCIKHGIPLDVGVQIKGCDDYEVAA